MEERIRRREIGLERDFLVALSQTLAAEVDGRAFEDFVVENGTDRSITAVARDVLTRAGWPCTPAT